MVAIGVNLKRLWDAINSKMTGTNNLSDVADAPTARTNLGLGSAATQSAAAFDSAGSAATVQSNLSKIADTTGNLYYRNGTKLTGITSALQYGSNHVLADASGNLYYGNNNVLANASGQLVFQNGNVFTDGTNINNVFGDLITDGSAFFYVGGGAIYDAGGMYYPDGTLFVEFGALYTPGGFPLADTESLWYPDTSGSVLASNSGLQLKGFPGSGSYPTGIAAGTMIWDSSTNQMKVYNGTAWKTVTLT